MISPAGEEFGALARRLCDVSLHRADSQGLIRPPAHELFPGGIPLAKAKKRRKSKARKVAARPPGPRPQSVTPHLAASDVAGALAWYKEAFGAKEMNRQIEPSGTILRASVKIGQSSVMLSDIFLGSEMKNPLFVGPSVNLHIQTKGIDAIFNEAVAAGAKVTVPLEDQSWGERFGKLQDPFGHSWGFSGKAKASKAELEAKSEEAMKSSSSGEHPGY
jgi:PhnB protein